MKPAEKLAQSLMMLKELQEKKIVALQATELTRTHRERLIKAGFLKEVIKGWYVAVHPDEHRGESTTWYAVYWNFCASYLTHRFGHAWCLSPEQSLLIHAENWTVPEQLLIRSPKGENKLVRLPHNTSVLSVRAMLPPMNEVEEKQGIRIFSVAASLMNCSAKFFTQYPNDARAVLAMLQEPSELLHKLLDGGHSTIAGRLCGALQNIGKSEVAEEIKKTMHAAGYDVRETDPFTTETPIYFSGREQSPAVNRLKTMWHEMRLQVIANFPKLKKNFLNVTSYLHAVEENFLNDAYHSLSIEGYQVSPTLIEKVQSGRWNPDDIEYDRNQRNALAARGYWQAFKAVEQSISQVLQGSNAGKIAEIDHKTWYRELFQPSVIAGLLKPSDLAGYRHSPVFIRHSMHVPPRAEIVSDLIYEFFQLLQIEEEVAVRVVLGHFFFVYIHPFLDGNGRIGRFLMNVMLASGNYPWTIIPIERRNEYMATLEKASVQQDIVPFSQFIASCIK